MKGDDRKINYNKSDHDDNQKGEERRRSTSLPDANNIEGITKMVQISLMHATITGHY